MAKIKTHFVCQHCSYESVKWLGKCPACSEWNTFLEEKKSTKPNGISRSGSAYSKLDDIQFERNARILTADTEFNRVLGGGIVAGSLVLIGGEPGIGKSTLMLQVAASLKNSVIAYISGEESKEQIKLRADRLGVQHNKFWLVSETVTDEVFKSIKKIKPDLVVVDSIQTLQSPYVDATAGGISQIRDCTAQLQQYAKNSQVPVIIIGHITKEGQLAGPKILEHTVDVVIQFEGDQHYAYRILRSIKNRFGSTSEIGIYEMLSSGLRAVNNPSELLINQYDTPLSGISIAATIEGQRALMIETQALVSRSAYGHPQRSTTGFDQRRLNMLLAVLEKKCGLVLSDQDVFVNIAGGLRVDDPATDLSIVAAVISSFQDIVIPQGMAFCGELGLGGEVRSVRKLEQRISEAEKMGFDVIVVPKLSKKLKATNIRLKEVKSVAELKSFLDQL